MESLPWFLYSGHALRHIYTKFYDPLYALGWLEQLFINIAKRVYEGWWNGLIYIYIYIRTFLLLVNHQGVNTNPQLCTCLSDRSIFYYETKGWIEESIFLYLFRYHGSVFYSNLWHVFCLHITSFCYLIVIIIIIMIIIPIRYGWKEKILDQKEECSVKLIWEYPSRRAGARLSATNKLIVTELQVVAKVVSPFHSRADHRSHNFSIRLDQDAGGRRLFPSRCFEKTRTNGTARSRIGYNLGIIIITPFDNVIYDITISATRVTRVRISLPSDKTILHRMNFFFFFITIVLNQFPDSLLQSSEVYAR